MLKVNIADTPHLVERGLMFVDNLPDDEGMLFVFPYAKRLNFWGRNTFIPLDIAFVNDKMQIVKIAKIKPLCLSGVDSGVVCKFAVEANDGYFSKNKISVGYKMKVDRKSGEVEAIIRFINSDNNEGSQLDLEKDIRSCGENIKQGQLTPVVDPLQPTKVDKPGDTNVGDPIGQQPQMSKLPILTKNDIGRILEDSFDEEEPEQPPIGEQPGQENAPELPGEEQPAPQQEYPPFQTAFEAVQWAEENSEVVHISYTTKKGRQLERDVEPHGQFHSDSTSRQILVTFDESVGDIRAFIISNIGNWKFVGKKFAKKFVVKG